MPDPLSLFEAGTFPRTGESGGQSLIPYRLLKPEASEPDRKYPLVVFLHGAGERGRDNRSQLKYLPTWMAQSEFRRKYPCYLIAPQCPAGEWWIDVDWSGPEPVRTVVMSDRLQAVVGAVDQVMETHPIDPDCQYLTGLSMGGFGAWDMAMRLPDRWAALLPICGGGDPRHVASLINLPIWCFHGELDDVVPPEYSRTMIDAIRRAGGNPRYTELKGVGHDSWTPAYRDSEALSWLFEQRRR